LYDICVEELNAGNRNNRHFTSTAYKSIAEKYYNRTRLKHSRVQLKNRLQGLRRLYTFWRWMNAHIGLGQANGTMVADDSWWEEHTKVFRLMWLKSSRTEHFL
jgi:hypothetical protein